MDDDLWTCVNCRTNFEDFTSWVKHRLWCTETLPSSSQDLQPVQNNSVVPEHPPHSYAQHYVPDINEQNDDLETLQELQDHQPMDHTAEQHSRIPVGSQVINDPGSGRIFETPPPERNPSAVPECSPPSYTNHFLMTLLAANSQRNLWPCQTCLTSFETLEKLHKHQQTHQTVVGNAEMSNPKVDVLQAMHDQGMQRHTPPPEQVGNVTVPGYRNGSKTDLGFDPRTRIFRCVICGIHLRHEANMKGHLDSHKSGSIHEPLFSETEGFICCDAYYTRWDEFHEHERIVHDCASSFSCFICLYRKFPDLSSRNKHMKETHHELKRCGGPNCQEN